MSKESEIEKGTRGGMEEGRGRGTGGNGGRGMQDEEVEMSPLRGEEDGNSESRKSSRAESHVRFSPPTVLTPKNLPDRSRLRSASSISLEDVSMVCET
eukprot:766926-Hanusia_phi.AAC.4